MPGGTTVSPRVRVYLAQRCNCAAGHFATPTDSFLTLPPTHTIGHYQPVANVRFQASYPSAGVQFCNACFRFGPASADLA
mgnify:CR=1 FL=1